MVFKKYLFFCIIFLGTTNIISSENHNKNNSNNNNNKRKNTNVDEDFNKKQRLEEINSFRSDFMKAVASNNIEYIKSVFELYKSQNLNININFTMPSNKNNSVSDPISPLMQAIINNRIEMIKLLINNGADINQNFANKNNSLLPYRHLLNTHNLDILKLILENNNFKMDSKINNIDKSIVILNEAIHNSCNLEIISYCLSFCKNINQVDFYNNTALELALHYALDYAVDILLKNGAKIYPGNKKENINDIFSAVMNLWILDQDGFEHKNYKEFIKIIQKLLEYRADINIAWNKYSLRYCEIDKEIENEKYKIILEIQPTLLHMAVQRGCKELVEFLIKNGAYINIQDNHGKTPLHYLYYGIDEYSLSSDIYISLDTMKDIAILLIRNGADVSIVNKEGKCPLDNPVVYEIYTNYKENIINNYKLLENNGDLDNSLNMPKELINIIGDYNSQIIFYMRQKELVKIIKLIHDKLNQVSPINQVNTINDLICDYII